MNVCKYFVLAGMSAFLTVTFLSLTPNCQADDSGSTQTVTNDVNGAAPDNSRQNKEDSVTADQQSDSPADLNLTKEIRQAVERSDQLSALAKNVKIITINGTVTLRGPVNTVEEKNDIEQIALQAAGKNNVNNELNVKNNQ